GICQQRHITSPICFAAPPARRVTRPSGPSSPAVLPPVAGIIRSAGPYLRVMRGANLIYGGPGGPRRGRERAAALAGPARQGTGAWLRAEARAGADLRGSLSIAQYRAD